MSEETYFQAVVSIMGQVHLHSALFISVPDAIAYVKKNDAYTWVGYVVVKVGK